MSQLLEMVLCRGTGLKQGRCLCRERAGRGVRPLNTVSTLGWGGARDPHHWLLFGVKAFKAVIEININDNCEE